MMKNSNTQDQATTSRIGSATPVVESQAPPERNASVDSAAFFEGDEYDDYDDFQAAGGSGGGAVGNNSSKMHKRSNNRGGGGGSGTIYSARHVRAKEAQRQSNSTAVRNKNVVTTKK